MLNVALVCPYLTTIKVMVNPIFNPKKLRRIEKMANGNGCTCAAMSEHECACNVDWRSKEEIFYKHKSEHLENKIENIKIWLSCIDSNQRGRLISIRDEIDTIKEEFEFGSNPH